MENFQPKIALIMRDDEIIKEFNLKRVTVNTSFGPVHRCYEGYIYDVPVLMIYGRFNSEKVPSSDINHEQNIEVVKNKNISKLIGTFVVGGINPEMPQGSVHIVRDLVGLAPYKIHWNQNQPFHNAEMYEPVCPKLTNMLINATENLDFPVKKDSIYVTFYGYPRIETKAELDYYHRQGWDIVGQTCDPEATLARLNKICYAAVCVQIDDPLGRSEYIDTLKEKKEANQYVESIKSCRKRTSKLILEFLKRFNEEECETCGKLIRKNNNFKEFPDDFYE